MNVPKDGPLGVEMLIHEKGAFLTVEEEAPFWMFWKTTRRCTVLLERWGLIWLYQTCAKVLRYNAVDSDFDELAADLAYSFNAVLGTVAETRSDQDEVLRAVAEQMRAKGWVKP